MKYFYFLTILFLFPSLVKAQSNYEVFDIPGEVVPCASLLDSFSTKVIITDDHKGIIVVPASDPTYGNTVVICWANLEFRGDTILFGSRKGYEVDSGFFNYNCRPMINTKLAIKAAYPSRWREFKGFPRVQRMSSGFRFIRRQNALEYMP